MSRGCRREKETRRLQAACPRCLTYDAVTGTVIYRSKMSLELKRNFQMILALKIVGAILCAAVLGAIIVASVFLVRSKSKGSVRVTSQLFFGIVLASFFLLPGFYMLIDKPEMLFDEGIIVVLTVIGTGFILLFMMFHEYLFKVLYRSVTIDLVPLARGNMVGMTVAHLTDLHLCRDKTLEGSIPAVLVEESCKRALRWGLDTAERVLITGDITDRGVPEEWDKFAAILKSLTAEERLRIDWIPGNHDLSFGEDDDTTPFGFTVTRSPWGLPYERRCRVFIGNLISRSSRTWRIYGKNGGLPFGEFIDRVSPYFREYENHPPFEKLEGGGQQYSYTLCSPDELRFAADQYGIGLPWPSSARPFMYQLLQEAYPIVFYEDAQYLIVGLNSCAVPAGSLLSGAFGALGSAQLQRVRDLANDREGRCLILLMHHHLGWPDALRNRLKDFSKQVEMKALQLIDAADLDEVLAKLNRTVIFHGHKHVRYEARRHSTTIVCGPSVAYGDNLSRAANCVAYSISTAGQVSVIDETNIAPYDKR